MFIAHLCTRDMHASHCRPSDAVEESLQYYKAQHTEEFIPQSLQRELLSDANHFDELASKAGLLGNRVAATWAGINDLLICSPVGSIGENLKLSTISGSHEERFQVLKCSRTLPAEEIYCNQHESDSELSYDPPGQAFYTGPIILCTLLYTCNLYR